MLRPSTQAQMIAKNLFPSSDGACPSDSETDLIHELEQKRTQLDNEVASFQAQKEKEFREFEQQIRSSRKHRVRDSTSRPTKSERSTSKERPHRSSSSSALDLLARHGTSRQCSTKGSSSKAVRGPNSKRNTLGTTAAPASSKPTLSLDPLNIKGETCPNPQIRSPSTPTLLSRNLSRSSSTSSAESSSSVPEPQQASPQLEDATIPNSGNKADGVFAGILTPSYLPLLDSKYNYDASASSALVTPPADDADVGATRGMITLPNGILPLQSSSFPPHGTILPTTGSATKRAYTAPAATRMPSALRSASAGNLAKKRKHVTFRLADSAIVDPSSSYEEGPSPLGAEERPSRSKSVSAVSHSSKKSSSLRYSNAGIRNGLIGDHSRSDEEDEAAGVKPGMGMDEVMQKLNDFNSVHDNNEDVILDYDDEEDVGWTDTKYHEDEDEDANDSEDEDGDEDEDHLTHGEQDEKVRKHHEGFEQHSLAPDTDSYFSPKFGEMSSMPTDRFRKGDEASQFRDRTGSSPLTPIRDRDWDSLSSSDKDRLLFSRRVSDDSDSDRSRKNHKLGPQLSQPTVKRASSSSSSLSALKKTGSTNSLSSLATTKALGGNFSKSLLSGQSTHPKQNKFENSLKRSLDGGSGVGFFELDEELASPDAGKADPFVLDTEDNGDDFGNEDEGIASNHTPINPGDSGDSNTLKSTFLGASSVPIAIVRPSVSVSSSWVGTFGH